MLTDAEFRDDLRRQNAMLLYRQHLDTCGECRARGMLCDLGWLLSRQLIYPQKQA
jgi:hypothetical protein